MTKSICALAHKSGSTREDFQRYYEDNHVPLAIGYFPFSSYARNHVVGEQSFSWDTISEFWADDIGATAALMAGPVGDIMIADEERFMDRSVIAPAGVEDVALTPGERAGPEGERTALLIQDSAGNVDLRAAIMDLGRSLASDYPGLSIDFTTNWSDTAFPAKAVLWLSGWQDPVIPQGLFVRRLLVRHVETPAARLLGSRPAAC